MSRIILKHQASAPTTPATGETAIWVDSTTKRILSKDDAGVEFDYARQIVTSTGPTTLTVGAVADGQYLQRSGSTLVGAAGGGSSEFDEADFRVFDTADTTKKVRFELGGVSTGLTRTVSIPDFNYTLNTIRESSGPTALTPGAIADGQMLVRSGATVVGQAIPSGGGGPYTIVEGFESDGGGGAGDAYYETTSDILNVGSFTLLIMVRLLWIDNSLTSRYQIMGTTQSFGSEGHGIEILTGFGGGTTTIRASTTGDAGTRVNADNTIDHASTVGRWLTLVCRRNGATVSGFCNGHLLGSATATGEPGAEPTGALTLGAPRGGGNGVVDAAEGVDFRGAGVVLGALSDAEVGEWSAACMEGEDVVAVPTGTGLSHRWRATGFADPWPDDIGSEDLDRVGTAPGLGTTTIDRFVL